VALLPPRSISAVDNIDTFDCGNDLLNDWLKRQAWRSEGSSARTYVVREGRRVVAYYCLATGGVSRSNLPRKLRHGLPDPVPVLILGRLAVDKASQRRGIGAGLLRDALRRSLQVSRDVGVRAVLVHAIDVEAMSFYMGYGFIEFPLGSRTLYLPIETIAKAL
jgi:GNAT superfamily N-acetyltransferase